MDAQKEYEHGLDVIVRKYREQIKESDRIHTETERVFRLNTFSKENAYFFYPQMANNTFTASTHRYLPITTYIFKSE